MERKAFFQTAEDQVGDGITLFRNIFKAADIHKAFLPVLFQSPG